MNKHNIPNHNLTEIFLIRVKQNMDNNVYELHITISDFYTKKKAFDNIKSARGRDGIDGYREWMIKLSKNRWSTDWTNAVEVMIERCRKEILKGYENSSACYELHHQDTGIITVFELCIKRCKEMKLKKPNFPVTSGKFDEW